MPPAQSGRGTWSWFIVGMVLTPIGGSLLLMAANRHELVQLGGPADYFFSTLTMAAGAGAPPVWLL